MGNDFLPQMFPLPVKMLSLQCQKAISYVFPEMQWQRGVVDRQNGAEIATNSQSDWFFPRSMAIFLWVEERWLNEWANGALEAMGVQLSRGEWMDGWTWMNTSRFLHNSAGIMPLPCGRPMKGEVIIPSDLSWLLCILCHFHHMTLDAVIISCQKFAKLSVLCIAN